MGESIAGRNLSILSGAGKKSRQLTLISGDHIENLIAAELTNRPRRSGSPVPVGAINPFVDKVGDTLVPGETVDTKTIRES